MSYPVYRRPSLAPVIFSSWTRECDDDEPEMLDDWGDTTDALHGDGKYRDEHELLLNAYPTAADQIDLSWQMRQNGFDPFDCNPFMTWTEVQGEMAADERSYEEDRAWWDQPLHGPYTTDLDVQHDLEEFGFDTYYSRCAGSYLSAREQGLIELNDRIADARAVNWADMPMPQWNRKKASWARTAKHARRDKSVKSRGHMTTASIQRWNRRAPMIPKGAYCAEDKLWHDKKRRAKLRRGEIAR